MFSTLSTSFRDYRKANRLADLRGGFTAAMIGIPTELIYGLIAVAPLGAAYQTLGVGAALYACIIAALINPLAGGHAGQIPGSRPALALIVAALIGDLLGRWPLWFGGNANPHELMAIVFVTVALAGLLQIAFGLLRLGQLVKYLPAPVLSGITNGVAILLLLQIIKPLLGIPGNVSWSDPAALREAFRPWSLLVGALSAALYIRPPRLVRKLPPIVLALGAGVILYYLVGFLAGASSLGPTFGAIPGALPEFTGSRLVGAGFGEHWRDVFRLILPSALTIAALGSIESLLSASAVDAITQSRHQSNRELVAQGVGNIAAGLFGGMPVAATMPRTMVNVNSGARTGLSSLIYAAIILVAVQALPAWLGAIPQVATAGILIGVAWQMIDPWSRRSLRKMLFERRQMPAPLWRSIAANGSVMLGVTMATLLFGLVWALAFGVFLTTLFFLRSNQKNVVRSVASGLERRSLRIRTSEQTQFLDMLGGDILILEAQGPLFFGSADKLAGEIDHRARSGDYLVVDLARVTYVDATAARVLQQTHQRLRGAGKKLYLSGLNPLDPERGEIFMMLSDAGFMPSSWFPDLDSALDSVEEEVLSIRFNPDDSWREHSLAETTLGRELDEGELETLRSYLSQRTYNRQDIIYREADAGDRLYILIRGTVSLYLSLGSGHEMRLTAFSAGTVFGSLAVLENKRRSNTAVADVEAVVLELTNAELERLLAEHPAIAARVMRNLSSSLAERLSHALESVRSAVSN